MKLDQTSDFSGAQLYRLLKTAEVKDYVKEAQLDDQGTLESLDESAFADSVTRAYPINSPSRVYISNMYLQDKRASLDKRYGPSYANTIEETIFKAAEDMGIKQDLVDFKAKLTEKKAKDYPVYVTAIEDTNPMTQEKENIELFPIKNAAELIKSAEIFERNIANYPFGWRQQIAKDFVEKAAIFNVDELPDLVCKYAGLFFPALGSDIATEIRRRSTKLANEESKKIVEQLVEVANDFEDPQDVFKIAELVETVERNEGLYNNRKVAQVLPDLVDMFFSYSAEKAAEILDVVEMGGQTFKTAELQKVSAEVYKEAFGIDIDPSNTEQLKEVLATMPMSDVALFREISNVNPI